ncbi:MAG: hypothetical protein RPR97_07795 [Colwellia sp.]|jgi:hypothetical protein
MSNYFDAQAVVSELKSQTKSLRKKSYRRKKSRLDKFHDEILVLKKDGASNAEVQRWLRAQKRIKICLSTVHRWVNKHG